MRQSQSRATFKQKRFRSSQKRNRWMIVQSLILKRVSLQSSLHWLPISSRIQYKIALTCFHIVSGTAAPYLSMSCFISVLLLLLFVQPQILGFSVSQGCAGGLLGRDPFNIGPVIWNSLSFSVRHATSLSSFKSKLKTHLFSSAF